MYRSILFLTIACVLYSSVGCAKHTGSVVSSDPFEMEGDPFQAAEQEMSSPPPSEESMYAAKTSAPMPQHPTQWSRSEPEATQMSSSNSAGFASTGTRMRFQASAPMPEILAEKPIARKPMVPPVNASTSMAPTQRESPVSTIQSAEFVTNANADSGVTPAGFERSQPEPRSMPKFEAAPGESPASLEMPVFAEDENSTSTTTDSFTSQATSDEWWKQ
ncbi:MAG: hypothetical protein HUJ26_14425 [Planctomycetaceae bacterium]|nr:hypothetical protein [Planctomycetaceae bacterium]